MIEKNFYTRKQAMFMIVLLMITLARTMLEMWLWHPSLLDAVVESLLVVQVGLAGLYTFCAHYFVFDKTSGSLARSTDDPLQQKVGIANLALGVLGILCCWLHGSFWLATGIAAIIFWSGTAVGRVDELVKRQNFHLLQYPQADRNKEGLRIFFLPAVQHDAVYQGEPKRSSNFTPGSTGVLLISDIGMSVLLLGLLGAYIIKG
jgi:hypothetical protein